MKMLFTLSKKGVGLILLAIMAFQAVAQNTCATAVAIASVPFSSGAQTTCGTVNDYAAGFSTCVSTNYGGGEDYVYSINITTAPVTYTLALGGAATWKIASVHSACPPAGANCVGGIATSSGTSASGNVTFPSNGTYYIIIDTWPAPDCGGFTLDITPPPPPPANDLCPGAIAFPTILTDGSCSNVTVSTVAATGSADPVCTGTEDDDVWYTFTTPAGVTSLLYTNTNISGNTDRVLQIYTGTCAGLTSIGCYDPELGTLTGLTGSTTYYLRAYTWGTGVTTTFNLCLRTTPPPPVNDNCAGALSVTVNAPSLCTFQTAGTVASATASTGAPVVCTGTADDDVWFSFVATSTGVNISLNNVTGSTTDLVHQVLSGACGAQVQVSCSDPNTSTVTGLTIGQTYYIRVFTWTATTGQTSAFNVCVSEIPPPPANDACAGAILISGCQSVSGTTIGATGDGLTTTCGTTVTSTSQGVWYRFVGDGNPVEVNTCSPGTNFDTKLQVFSGSCAGLVCVGGNDDSLPIDPACDLGGLNRKSKVNWTSTLGVTYYIYVYPFSNPGGNFVLNLISGPACTAPAPVANSVGTTSASISWGAVGGAVNYTYSFGTAGHVCGTGAVSQAGTSVNLSGLTPNTTYTFCVRTNCSCGSSSYATVMFTTQPLPNDACAGAQTITCGSTTNGSTVGAASDAAVGSCGVGTGGTPGNGVWYKLVGNGAQVTASLCGSAYDTKLHVYTGTCAGLTCLVSNDDNAAACGAGSTRSQVIFNANVGTDYYILVSGFLSNTGAFSLNLTCLCGPELGAPWTVTNIGASNGGAIENVCDGTIDVKATNYGSPTNDVQTYAWQQMCGNGFIKAKVENVTNGGWGGIMFRENNAGGSRKIALRTQLTSAVVRDLRAATNGMMQQQQFPKPNTPQWLRLTRNGNVFLGETSNDGVNWDFTFSVTLVLPSCIEVGLFAQSINVNTTTTAVFSNVMGVPLTPPVIPLVGGNAPELNVAELDFSVFPNPTQSEINVKMGEEFIGKDVTIRISNQLGQTVLTRRLGEVQNQVENIQLNNLPDGMYIMTLQTEGSHSLTKKFVVGLNRP